MGGCGEGDVAVPAGPEASFKYPRAVVVTVVVLDAPAACGPADQRGVPLGRSDRQ